jgi:starvation-inducible DNA-binding protein
MNLGKQFLLLFCIVSLVSSVYAVNETDKTISVELNQSLEPNIGISPENRQETAFLLNNLLADEYLLYTKTFNYHWNVHGTLFHDLHMFLGEQYAALQEIADLVAERVRALGFRAAGTMGEFLDMSQLQEHEGVPPALEMVRNLLNDHESIIRSIRKDIVATDEFGDVGTSNFLQELIIRHEKMAWMLRSYLLIEAPKF